MKAFLQLINVNVPAFRMALAFLMLVTCAQSAQAGAEIDYGQALAGSWAWYSRGWFSLATAIAAVEESLHFRTMVGPPRLTGCSYSIRLLGDL